MTFQRVGSKDRHHRHHRHPALKFNVLRVTQLDLGSSRVASPSAFYPSRSAAGDDGGDDRVTHAQTRSSPPNAPNGKDFFSASSLGDDGDGKRRLLTERCL
jgi:hypothetical protein